MNATDHGPEVRDERRTPGTPARPRARSRAGRAARRSRSAAAASPDARGRAARRGRRCEVRRARGRAVRDEGHAARRASRLVSPILPANSRPANRRRFFVHWRGRSATSAARPTERGTATAVTAIGRMVDGRPPRPSCRAPLGSTALRATQEGGITGRRRSNRLPVAELALELDPAAERDRQLAGDREPEPRAAAVARPERPEDPLLSDGLIPGPVSATETETVPFAAASASSTRPPSGVQRKAFESRLETIWNTRSPSETITGAPSLSQR